MHHEDVQPGILYEAGTSEQVMLGPAPDPSRAQLATIQIARANQFSK